MFHVSLSRVEALWAQMQDPLLFPHLIREDAGTNLEDEGLCALAYSL